MSTWMHDIRTLLKDAKLVNVGNAQSWPCFVGELPAQPDQCVALFPYTGTTGHGRDDVRLQVRVRGGRMDKGTSPSPYDAAFEKAEAIRLYLLDVAAQQVGTTDIRWVEPIGTTNSIGPDSCTRAEFTVNLEVAKSRAIAAA